MEREERETTTREGYAHWAPSYDADANPMTAMVAHVMAGGGLDLTGLDVLELGCGTGKNVGALLGLGATRYVGVDDSPEMLGQAAQRERDDGRVRFERRDLRDPWPEGLGPFDVAFVSLVLEHFGDASPVLGFAARAVRPGGQLWVLDVHPAAHAKGARAHVESDGEILRLPSFEHTAASLAGCLLRTGWEPVSSTDWYATEVAARTCAKLERYRPHPMLLDVRAVRTD